MILLAYGPWYCRYCGAPFSSEAEGCGPLQGRARAAVSDESPPVPADDPTRDPNWCHAHQQMWPACAGQHEES